MTNRKRTLGLVALALALVMAIAWYWLAPGETPAGQSPLVTMDAPALESIRADFNAAKNQVRLIVLLSPT